MSREGMAGLPSTTLAPVQVGAPCLVAMHVGRDPIPHIDRSATRSNPL